MESGSQKLSEKGKVSKVRAKDKNDWRDSYETTQPMQTSKKKKKNDDDTLGVYKEKYECSKITPTKN